VNPTLRGYNKEDIMTPDEVNAWFTPFHYAVYLGVPFIGMVIYFQWRWARTCKNYIQILVAEQGGGGKFVLAPKTGGEVSITNHVTGVTRVWALNELATIDVLYPGVGFVPGFMQKQIRMAIVSEGDWEPLLNRSPHMQKIVSPDMVEGFKAIAENADDKTKKAIIAMLEGVSTSPTREMIASPAVLGNLIQERITALAVTVAKDIMNPLTEAIKKMGKRVDPLTVYIGLGLSVILLAFIIFKLMPVLEGLEDMVNNVNLIKQSLGVQ